ncbi:bactofilin family protein [Thermovibrio sp.]
MIKKKNKVENGEIKSILSSELKIEGNIFATGKVRIDGEVLGDVSGDFIIFGESSKIKGNVKAKRVILMGSVEGDVEATEVEIKSSAKVKGNLSVKELSIESGASVEGAVKSGKFLEGQSGRPEKK